MTLFLDPANPGSVLGVLLAIGLLIRLFPLFLRPDRLVRYVADDAYMYFKLAQNIGAGRGATFDGVSKTNGFHPLYAVLLVPIFRAFRSDALTPIRIALLLLALSNVATAVLVFAIVNLAIGPGAALFAAAVWLFNPRVVFTSGQGLEAAIWVFFGALSSYLWLWMKVGGHAFEPGWVALLGVTLGLAFLSRSEGLLLFAAVAVDLVLTGGGPGGPAVLTRLVLLGIVALAVVSPWLFWSWRNFGRLSQISGDILSYKHHADILDDVSGRSLGKFVLIAGLNITTAIHRTLEFALGSPILTAAVLGVAGGVIAAGGARGDDAAGALAFLWAFPALHILAYGGWFWRFQDWYYLFIGFVGAVFAGLTAGLLPAGSPLFLGLSLIAAVTYATKLLWTAVTGVEHLAVQGSMYHAALWVREHTQPDARVGSINTGIIGYYAGRTVFNLSGCVNNVAAAAIRSRRLLDYLGQAGIHFFVDFDSAIDTYRRYWGGDVRSWLRRVATLPGAWRGGPMTMYRVTGPAARPVPEAESGRVQVG